MKKLLIHPTPGGGGSQGNWGGGSTFQKSGKFHELPRKSIHCCLPPPPTPTQLVGGGGLGVKIGGTDGREGGTDEREGGM